MTALSHRDHVGAKTIPTGCPGILSYVLILVHPPTRLATGARSRTAHHILLCPLRCSLRTSHALICSQHAHNLVLPHVRSTLTQSAIISLRLSCRTSANTSPSNLNASIDEPHPRRQDGREIDASSFRVPFLTSCSGTALRLGRTPLECNLSPKVTNARTAPGCHPASRRPHFSTRSTPRRASKMSDSHPSSPKAGSAFEDRYEMRGEEVARRKRRMKD